MRRRRSYGRRRKSRGRRGRSLRRHSARPIRIGRRL